MNSNTMRNKSLALQPLTRRAEAARRIRILEGYYNEDLKAQARRLLGDVRLKGLGQLSSVRNALAQIVTRYAVQYIRPPFVTGLDPELSKLIGDYNSQVVIEEYKGVGGYPMPSKMSQIGQVTQRSWIAANDCAIIVEKGAHGVVLKSVDPSVLQGEQAQDDPGQPIVLRWQRKRQIDDKWCIVCDEWDISDPANPTYRVLDTEMLDDGDDYSGVTEVTNKVFVKDGKPVPMSGESYPWVWTQGARKGGPYIPARIYHSHYNGQLWTPYRGIEIVDGTLVAGVLWSFWIHCVFDASWPQRWASNASVPGSIPGPDGNSGVVTDPATLLLLEAIKKGEPIQVGQFNPGADPEALGRAIDNFCLQLEAQIVPVDITSTGGDPLAQIADAREQVISSYDLVCREGDGAILEICASVANAAFGKAFKEDGYGIVYRDEIDAIISGPAVKYDGAQIAAVTNIAKMVKADEISIESGIALLETLLNFSQEDAKRMLSAA